MGERLIFQQARGLRAAGIYVRALRIWTFPRPLHQYGIMLVRNATITADEVASEAKEKP